MHKQTAANHTCSLSKQSAKETPLMLTRRAAAAAARRGAREAARAARAARAHRRQPQPHEVLDRRREPRAAARRGVDRARVAREQRVHEQRVVGAHRRLERGRGGAGSAALARRRGRRRRRRLREALALAQHRGTVLRAERDRVGEPRLEQRREAAGSTAAAAAAARERPRRRAGVGRARRRAQREVVGAAAQRVVDLRPRGVLAAGLLEVERAAVLEAHREVRLHVAQAVGVAAALRDGAVLRDRAAHVAREEAREVRAAALHERVEELTAGPAGPTAAVAAAAVTAAAAAGAEPPRARRREDVAKQLPHARHRGRARRRAAGAAALLVGGARRAKLGDRVDGLVARRRRVEAPHDGEVRRLARAQPRAAGRPRTAARARRDGAKRQLGRAADAAAKAAAEPRVRRDRAEQPPLVRRPVARHRLVEVALEREDAVLLRLLDRREHARLLDLREVVVDIRGAHAGTAAAKDVGDLRRELERRDVLLQAPRVEALVGEQAARGGLVGGAAHAARARARHLAALQQALQVALHDRVAMVVLW